MKIYSLRQFVLGTLAVIALCAVSRSLWSQQIPSSEELAKAAAQRRAAKNFPSNWWPEMSKHDDAWYRSPDGLRIAANILSWQDTNGAWPLMNTTNVPWTGDTSQIGPWGRHGAMVASTANEMRFLARATRATGSAADKAALVRAVNFLLDAQYPSGGWPKGYPDFEEPYFRYVSLNDDETTDVLTILREVATSSDFNVLDPALRHKAKAAFDRGIAFLLKAQIVVNGKRTAWAQQFDPVTYQPMPARTFEPAAITGNESAGILLLLMSIKHPANAEKNAIRDGVAWYKQAQINGIRFEMVDGDRVVVPDPAAPPLWARYYDLKTDKPVFMGRDSIPRDKVAGIEKERRVGYAWYGPWGTPVLDAYPAWERAHPR